MPLFGVASSDRLHQNLDLTKVKVYLENTEAYNSTLCTLHGTFLMLGAGEKASFPQAGRTVFLQGLGQELPDFGPGR